MSTSSLSECVIEYKSGFKYQLTETVEVKIPLKGYDVTTDYITLTTDGLLTVKKGYAWDGPSGPTTGTPSFMFSSLVHSVLYQLIRMGLLPSELRGFADLLLRFISKKCGMWRVRAWYAWRAVRRLAGFAADPSFKESEESSSSSRNYFKGYREMKPGFKSSEFLIISVVILFGVLTMFGKISGDDIDQTTQRISEMSDSIPALIAAIKSLASEFGTLLVLAGLGWAYLKRRTGLKGKELNKF